MDMCKIIVCFIYSLSLSLLVPSVKQTKEKHYTKVTYINLQTYLSIVACVRVCVYIRTFTFFDQWHIFIILIVSCISSIVARSNLSIIALIGMEVYKSFKISKGLHIQIMRYDVKIMFFHYILYCGGQGCPP